MIGYAAKEVFTKRELGLLARAESLVEAVPYDLQGEPVRCHELARAVGKILNLEHADGRFGFVEHTWLWTLPLKEADVPDQAKAFCAPWVLPNVLDVYVPGSVPQVQLVHMAASGLPPRYYLSNIFDVVIKEDIVSELVKLMSWRTGMDDSGCLFCRGAGCSHCASCVYCNGANGKGCVQCRPGKYV